MKLDDTEVSKFVKLKFSDKDVLEVQREVATKVAKHIRRLAWLNGHSFVVASQDAQHVFDNLIHQ